MLMLSDAWRCEVGIAVVRTSAHRGRLDGHRELRHEARLAGLALEWRRLFTEVAGAFLLGYGLGGLIAQPDAVATGGRPGTPVIGGRFGRLGGLAAGLQYTLAIVGAAVAILTRLDLSGLVLRGATPRNGLATYIGWDANVIAPITAGGYGQIAMKDGMGYPLSAVATAETDIPKGTPVKVIGTKGANLLVAPVSSS